MRFPGVAAVAAAVAVVLAGCGSSSKAGARPERARADTAPLWALAPAESTMGWVVADGAGVELLATLRTWIDAVAAHPVGAAGVAELRAGLAEAPFDLLSVEGWRNAGIDPARGFALFLLPNDDDGDEPVVVLPVVDRAKFRQVLGMRAAEQDGVSLDVLDDKMACRELKQRYVCTRHLADVLRLAPTTSPLATRVAETPPWARGDVELAVVFPDGPVATTPLITGPTMVMSVLRLEADGAEWRTFLDARVRSGDPTFGAGWPPADWSALTAGATGSLRAHTPTTSFAELAGTIGGPGGALLAELDGEILGVARGQGVVAGALWLGVRDTRAAGAALEALCAQASSAVPDLAWDATRHECAYAPQVPGLGALRLSARIDHKRLVVDMGGGATPPANGVPLATRAGSPAVAALLRGPAIAVIWATGLDVWARLPPPLRTAVDGLAGGEVIGFVDLASYLAAHLYDATFALAWDGDGGRLTLRVTTFAGDPPAARAAHQGALALRARGKLDEYKQALADGGRAHPGTMLARQADVVLGDGPVLGGPVALLGGATAAVAIPAFQRYQAKSKTTEAVWGIKRMYDGARSYYLDESDRDARGNLVEKRFPPSSSGPTPPLGACCAQGGTCAPDPAIWDTPTWNALKFSMDDPHLYSYEFVSDGATFTARALGDLDCDGDYATYEMVGAVDESGNVTGSAGIYKAKELE